MSSTPDAETVHSSDTGKAPAPPPSGDISEIEADIAERREQLGETVDELAARLNVKARAQRKVGSVKESGSAELRRSVDRIRSGDPAEIATALAPAVLVAAGLALVLLIARRRRR